MLYGTLVGNTAPVWCPQRVPLSLVLGHPDRVMVWAGRPDAGLVCQLVLSSWSLQGSHRFTIQYSLGRFSIYLKRILFPDLGADIWLGALAGVVMEGLPAQHRGVPMSPSSPSFCLLLHLVFVSQEPFWSFPMAYPTPKGRSGTRW